MEKTADAVVIGGGIWGQRYPFSAEEALWQGAASGEWDAGGSEHRTCSGQRANLLLKSADGEARRANV